MSDELDKALEVKLPEKAIERLHFLRDQEKDSKIEIGDFSVELIDEWGKTFGKAAVRKRIGIEYGCAEDTIRDREGWCRFFGPAVRDENPAIFDVLSYHQLRACKPAGKEGWVDLANWAIESADDFGGRPAPVAAIVARRKGEDADELERWERLFKGAYEKCEDLVEEENVPALVVQAAQTFVDTMAGWYETVTGEKKQPIPVPDMEPVEVEGEEPEPEPA